MTGGGAPQESGELFKYVDEHFADFGKEYAWSSSGTVEVTDGPALRLASTNQPNSIIGLETAVPQKHVLEFKARVGRFGTGEVTSNKSTLASKIAIDDTYRLMFSIEETELRFCSGGSTWGGHYSFEAGNDWHVYRFEVEKSDNPTAKLYIDDDYKCDITLQKDKNGDLIQFWSQGTPGQPTEAFLEYVTLAYEVPADSVPIWSKREKLRVTEVLDDRISVEWDAPRMAVDGYRLYADGKLAGEVDGAAASYTFTGLEESTSYLFKVEAGNANGYSSDGPSVTASTPFDPASNKLGESVVWQAGTEGYGHFRIPGIVTTAAGTLLAYTEARKNAGDWAPMDVLMKRSTDGGNTWSESQMLAAGSQAGKTVNNPVMIASRDGTVHLLYCVMYGVESSNGGVFYRRSDDDGVSWSEPEEISDMTSPEIRNVIATGPGHGIELRDGTLLVPVWLVLKESGEADMSHHPAVVTTLYSTDAGGSWQLGELVHPTGEMSDPNETTAVELSDGSVMLNMRNVSPAKRRSITVSPNGCDGWSEPRFDDALPDPTCFGSLVRYDSGTILFVNAESTSSRSNITVKASYDDGRTWSAKRTILAKDGGYSDITVDADGTVCVLAENSPGGNFTLKLLRFSLDWLEADNKASLKAVSFEPQAEIEPAFSPLVNDYQVRVAEGTAALDIRFVPFDGTAEIAVNGEVLPGDSFRAELTGLRTPVSVEVRAGGRTVGYTFTVLRDGKVPEDALILHYDMERLSGGMVPDLSGLGNSAAARNVSITADGRYGSGLACGGSGSFLDVNEPLGGDFGEGEFTASLWVKPSDLTDQKLLFWYGGYTAGAKQWWVRLNSGTLQFNIGNGAEESTLNAAEKIRAGRWTHLAIVNRAQAQEIYIDGKLSASKPKDRQYDVNGENILRIGMSKNNGSATREFKGAMDEVRLYNYALSAGEILALKGARSADEAASRGSFTDSAGTTLPYRLILPEDYSADRTYPLVLFLHGAGARGTDNEKQLAEAGVFQKILDRQDADYDCIMVAPQIGTDSQWVNTRGRTAPTTCRRPRRAPRCRRLRSCSKSSAATTASTGTRLYLVGISMGGYGVWDMAMRSPDLFAAAVPICGAGDPEEAALLKNLPVWAFHGRRGPDRAGCRFPRNDGGPAGGGRRGALHRISRRGPQLLVQRL